HIIRTSRLLRLHYAHARHQRRGGRDTASVTRYAPDQFPAIESSIEIKMNQAAYGTIVLVHRSTSERFDSHYMSLAGYLKLAILTCSYRAKIDSNERCFGHEPRKGVGKIGRR